MRILSFNVKVTIIQIFVQYLIIDYLAYFSRNFKCSANFFWLTVSPSSTILFIFLKIFLCFNFVAVILCISSLQPHQNDCVRLIQSVKAICAPMDSLMTLDVLTGLQRLETCLSSWRGPSSHIDLNAILLRLEASLFTLIRLYCALYELPFTAMDDERRTVMAAKKPMCSQNCHQTVSLYVGCLHRVDIQKMSRLV